MALTLELKREWHENIFFHIGCASIAYYDKNISLRFLSIILRVLRLEVSVYNVDAQGGVGSEMLCSLYPVLVVVSPAALR